MNTLSLDHFYEIVAKNNFYTKADRLKFYLEEQLFRGIDFTGKSLIDIGGGSGLFGFYAALQGASKVVIMEPEFDGSSSGMIEGFKKLKTLLGNPQNISITTKVLEEYDRVNNQFDYILMHNSINHIDEDACIVLKTDPVAQQKYYTFFEKLQEISNPDTTLIVCDCARNNLFGDLNLTNPMASSIEWEKHQNPSFWAKLLSKNGYDLQSISWTSPNFMGSLGKALMSNRPVSYFTNSHFRMIMKNKKYTSKVRDTKSNTIINTPD